MCQTLKLASYEASSHLCFYFSAQYLGLGFESPVLISHHTTAFSLNLVQHNLVVSLLFLAEILKATTANLASQDTSQLCRQSLVRQEGSSSWPMAQSCEDALRVIHPVFKVQSLFSQRAPRNQLPAYPQSLSPPVVGEPC
ncbi:hypothetical protein FALCPG4_000145 [Fusarium falciforme]